MRIFLNFITFNKNGTLVRARDLIESLNSNENGDNENNNENRRNRGTITVSSTYDRTITLTYDGDHNQVWKLVIDKEYHFYKMGTELVFNNMLRAFEFINNIDKNIRFSFYSTDYPLGCHLFTDRGNDFEEQLLAMLNNNLSFLSKFATENRASYVRPTLLYGSQTTRFRPLNAFHALTKIWDIINTIIRTEAIVLNTYREEFERIVEKILHDRQLKDVYTYEDLERELNDIEKSEYYESLVERADKIIYVSEKLAPVLKIEGLYSRLFSGDGSEVRALLETNLADITDEKVKEIEELLRSRINDFIKEKGIKEVMKREALDFMSNYFTIGGDPEIMGYTSIQNRTPTRAYNYLQFQEPNTYYRRIFIGSVGTDGNNALYEIRPSASKDPITLLGKFYKLLSYANVGDGYKIHDYIALWNSNCQNYPLGGHIHIGSNNNDFATYLADNANRIRTELDRTLGLERVFYDLSTEERQRSGFAASSYETKPWGFEYRTPPAIVWTEPKLFILTTTMIFFISLREYLYWKGHELADVMSSIIQDIIQNTAKKLKEQARQFNNKLFYVDDKDFESKFLRRISASIGLKVESVDDMIMKGFKMYVYYVGKVIDGVVDEVVV